MKDLWKILFGLLCGLLAAGLVLLIAEPPRAHPIRLIPPPSPAPIVIHVSGAVIKPGVYYLESGSRVWDAIQAAGGFSSDADQNSLNLAAFAEDGSQIRVPILTNTPPPEQIPSQTASPNPPSPSPSVPVQTSSPRIQFPIDINTASSEELELLPQIGQVRAARIFSYRQTHGYFKRVEDIRNVYDITPEVYAAIRDLITASQPRETTQATSSSSPP